MPGKLSDFIPVDGQKRIAQAITEAERRTSGEICVHVTPHTHGNTLRRATKTFNRLGLYRTVGRNAVLIFIAYKDRRVAILGDTGINAQVADNFWDEATALLTGGLAQGNVVEGICKTIALIGEQLSNLFPARRDDVNELSNEVTYED